LQQVTDQPASYCHEDLRPCGLHGVDRPRPALAIVYAVTETRSNGFYFPSKVAIKVIQRRPEQTALALPFEQRAAEFSQAFPIRTSRAF